MSPADVTTSMMGTNYLLSSYNYLVTTVLVSESSYNYFLTTGTPTVK